MTQTAVEWLIDELIKNAHIKDAIQNDFVRLSKVFEQAKQMEDEQLQAKYGEGYDEGLYDSENK